MRETTRLSFSLAAAAFATAALAQDWSLPADRETLKRDFLAPGDTGSWEGVPVETRMPMFNRRQQAHWSASDYEVKSSGLQGAASGDSAVYRMPRPGTALYRQMLAATPATYLTGYRLAIE